mgnify:CR=1 FL=1
MFHAGVLANKVGNESMIQLFNFMPHIALSSGSACTSGTIEKSHVLRAMKLSDERIDGSFRISFGRSTSKSELKELIKSLEKQC